ncbi:MAG: hypothetical protein QOE72_4964, partial [Chloroflexota bacterium]|nr:hypothetical protein [Chloroflexota bacterium]
AAYAAQSHPNCRPSDRLTTTPSVPLGVSPEQRHVDQRHTSGSNRPVARRRNRSSIGSQHVEYLVSQSAP